MKTAVLGIGIGLLGALAFARETRSLLFAVSPTDPLTYAGVAGVLFLVALLASVFPTHRALGIDPLEAIRSD
jgi:ABC-type antimicrobial peptide transport system permease subunit